MIHFKNICALAVAVSLSIFLAQSTFAQNETQYKYVDGKELTVLGRPPAVDANTYHRMDSSSRIKMTKRVAELATNAAGISINFESNTKSIRVKWVLGQFNTLWNMTPVAINGLDLYGWKENKWQYIASARPVADSNNVVVISNLDGSIRNYRIHLPLYAELKKIEIGVDADAQIQKANLAGQPGKKVVIYGSSITQGASASRPGMAYPSILSRQLNIETFNLGFSGSGKMELPVADVLAAMPADVYILDCVPNPTPQEIKDRALPFIKRLRALKPGVPIIMVESIIREDAYWNSSKMNRVKAQNEAFKNAYQQLTKEDYQHLYYISAENLIGQDHEATIDGTHLTDVGFIRIAEQIGIVLKKVLR